MGKADPENSQPWTPPVFPGSADEAAPVFVYHDPTSLAEALDLLQHYDGEAKVLAGGPVPPPTPPSPTLPEEALLSAVKTCSFLT